MLSLPPEIRNLIYCSVYAFKSIYPATRNGLRSLILFSDNGFEDELPPSEVLALLLVNRQILKEAAAIFYGKIQFEQFMHDMPRFIKGIGRMRANLLTDLVLVQSQDMILEHSPLECLFPLEGLRIVRLEFEYEYFPNLKDELLRAGILQFTGRFDIEVLNTWPDTEVYVDRVAPIFSPDNYTSQHPQASSLKAQARQNKNHTPYQNAHNPTSPNMKKKNLTLAALTASALLPTPTTPTSPISPILSSPLNQSITQYPLNASFFPATRNTLEFHPYPAGDNANGTDGGLSDRCTRCGTKGCFCSSVNDNTTDGILPFKSCSSCQDTNEGMVCYCAEKVQEAKACTDLPGNQVFPCRLNEVEAPHGPWAYDAGDAGGNDTGNDAGDDAGNDAGDAGATPKANMVGAGEKGKGVAVGAVAVAALGAVAGMTL